MFIIFILAVVSIEIKLCPFAFNVDDREMSRDVFNVSTSADDFAGYSVAARKERDRVRLVMGAPHHPSSGAIVECFAEMENITGQRKDARWLSHPSCDVTIDGESIAIGVNHLRSSSSLGLSLVMNDDQHLVACAPGRRKQCGMSNIYVPGACYYGILHNDITMLTDWGEIRCFQTYLDVVFLIDSSSSITSDNFELMKSVLINVSGVFSHSIGDTTQIGILQYGSGPTYDSNVAKHFANPTKLGDCHVIECLQDAIRHNMTHLRATNTYTAHAIERAVKIDFQKSSNLERSVKVLVLITDGSATDHQDLEDIFHLTADHNVTVYAIGVGFNDTVEQLRTSANGGLSDERVLTTGDFRELNSQLQILTKEISQVTAEGSGSTSASLENSQLGFSVHHSNLDGNIYLGAVGAYEWTGTVAKYTPTDGATRTLGRPSIESMFQGEAKNSYLGYEITTGNYNGGGKVYVGVAAPRYRFHGAVVVYHSNNVTEVYIIRPPQHGADHIQPGAYFGGSLLSTDVNGDGSDDLFIGSPLYTGQHYDEGRVFVYVTKGGSSLDQWVTTGYEPLTLSGYKLKGGRFGTAVTSAGDLNDDGYNDIIIAAPYSESDNGIVYIYHGSVNGIDVTVKQVIRSSSNLKYFGLSLLGGADLNSDSYPDVVIGSPSNGAVVVMRTRPIARLTGNLTLDSDVIDVFACARVAGRQCVRVEACLLFCGKSVEATAEVEFNIHVDPILKRVQFRKNNSETLSVLPVQTGKMRLKRNMPECRIFPLQVQKKVEDFSSAVDLEMVFHMTSSHLSQPLSSMVDPSNARSVATSGRFEINCGIDKICSSDLRAIASAHIPFFVSPGNDEEAVDWSDGGRTLVVAAETVIRPIVIKTNLSNAGEHAYGAVVILTYPAALTWQHVATIKSSNHEFSDCILDQSPGSIKGSRKVKVLTHVWDQELGSVLPAGQWCYFEIRLSFANLRRTPTEGQLFIALRAHTEDSQTGRETNLADNKWNVTIPTRYRADVKVARKSSENVIAFNFTGGNSTVTAVTQIGANTSDVIMQFQIENLGFTSIDKAALSLTYPSMYTPIHPLLYLYKVKCASSQGIPGCSCQHDVINRLNLLVVNSSSDDVNAVEVISNPTLLQRTFFDCSTNLTSHWCDALLCDITKLNPTDKVTLTATFRVWTETLHLQNVSEVVFRSRLAVSTEESPYVIDRYGNNPTVMTTEVDTIATLYQASVRTPVQNLTWVFVAGAGGGLLLLLIVVAIMYKGGMFNNKFYDVQMMQERGVAEGVIGHLEDEPVRM